MDPAPSDVFRKAVPHLLIRCDHKAPQFFICMKRAQSQIVSGTERRQFFFLDRVMVPVIDLYQRPHHDSNGDLLYLFNECGKILCPALPFSFHSCFLLLKKTPVVFCYTTDIEESFFYKNGKRFFAITKAPVSRR